jgi:MerR family transcriptional regulator, global nitrogen regulator
VIFIVQPQKDSYIDRKVISIGVVRELTGLSDRQIRYYEERKLVFPERSKGGSRKYSFSDVKALVEIADKIEDGVQTNEIRQEKIKENRKIEQEKMRKKMLQGQLNAHFGTRN